MITDIRTESYACQELIVSSLLSNMEPMVTKDNKQAFSNRLNAVLDHAGIPPKGKGRQGVLAKIFNVSDKGARKWIEGESIPSTTKALPAIVERFGVTAEWLLTGNPDYAPSWLTEKEGNTATIEPSGFIIKNLYHIPLITWHEIAHILDKTYNKQECNTMPITEQAPPSPC